MVLVNLVGELERSLIVERAKAGMRCARLKRWQIGRAPLAVDRAALLRDRARGMKLAQLAKAYGISKASVCRLIEDTNSHVTQEFPRAASTSTELKELSRRKRRRNTVFKTLG